MNLVAKEYAAARDDEKGVLILSQYTGASRELKEALEMLPKEQTKRMHDMRETIKNYSKLRVDERS